MYLRTVRESTARGGRHSTRARDMAIYNMAIVQHTHGRSRARETRARSYRMLSYGRW